MGAIQSSINQALGTAAAGVAAVGRTSELIKSNKLAESQNEIAKAQNEYAKAQNELAQLEAKKELNNAEDEYNRNTHQYLSEATLNLTDEDFDKNLDGNTAVDNYLNKIRSDGLKKESEAFAEYNYNNALFKDTWGDGTKPEDKLKLALAGNNKKDAERLEKSRSRLAMAKKANLALDEEITARNNLKFNVQIAEQKIKALQLDKKAKELNSKGDK